MKDEVLRIIHVSVCFWALMIASVFWDIPHWTWILAIFFLLAHTYYSLSVAIRATAVTAQNDIIKLREDLHDTQDLLAASIRRLEALQVEMKSGSQNDVIEEVYASGCEELAVNHGMAHSPHNHPVSGRWTDTIGSRHKA